jgi:hypothetical protein
MAVPPWTAKRPASNGSWAEPGKPGAQQEIPVPITFLFPPGSRAKRVWLPRRPLARRRPHYDIPSECDPLDRSLAEAFMRDSATREGVSLDLVREVIRQESGFQPCVVSSKGAMGMMQLMPDTANALGVIDPFDPRQNIDGGVRLLRRLLDKYQGRPDLALAAYNAGEGAVDRNNAVPDYEETRDYVRAIMRRVFEEAPEKPRTPRAARIASPARIPSPSFGTPAPVEAPATDETPLAASGQPSHT